MDNFNQLKHRRAVLAGKSNLNAPDNFLKHLVPVVVEYLKPTYEGIQDIEENIVKHVSEAEGKNIYILYLCNQFFIAF